MITAMETETDIHQLMQEIVRVTGIIKVNYPVLYASLYETPLFTSYEDEELEEEDFQDYLEFLNGQLAIHKATYGKRWK